MLVYFNVAVDEEEGAIRGGRSRAKSPNNISASCGKDRDACIRTTVRAEECVPFSYKRTGSKVEAWSHCAGALEGPHGAGSVIPAGIGSLFGSAADLYLRHGVEIMTRGL